MAKPTLERRLENAQQLAKLLDYQVSIFGVRVGIDPLLGLIPGAGDAAGLVLASYIFFIAQEMKLPREEQSKIIFNMVFDFVIGLIPVAGDIVDFFYRANQKNMQILLEYQRKQKQ